MNIINTLNDKRFTLNGIQYFKNYVSVVHGNKIEVFNCYERKDVLIELAHYNQFTVNGTVYSSAALLQEALLPVLYSRINMGDGSTFAQNNIGRTINIGFYMGDASIATIVSMMNNRTTTISSTDTPVVLSLISLPASLGNSQVTNKKYSYLFKPGEGVYGIGGTTVTSSMIFQLASLNLTPEDIQNTPGAIIYNLDPVSNGDYINKANETTWDFTDSGEINEDGTFTTYYFSYTSEDILYFAQFKGTPGIYGLGNTPFEEEDFASTTNSNITPEKTKLSEFTNDVPFVTVAEVNGLDIIVNQAAAELYLKNSEGTTLATVNLGFLNNEGTTFFYNPVTKDLELKNDAGEVLSTVPVSAFVSNLIQSVNFNAVTPSILEFKDSTGTLVTSVTFTINNISGLQTALDFKAPLASPVFTGTPSTPNMAASTTGNQIANADFVQAVAGSKIAQTITDGITTSAPSQDAIYDNFKKYQVIAELNLDNVFETGSYLTQGSGVANLPNGWLQGRHMLSVIGAIGQVYATQIITSITTGRIAFRRYSNPNWLGWVEFSETTKTLTQGPNIPASTDLNTYTTTGLYLGIAGNATIDLNYPIVEGGMLEVVAGASNQIFQKYHSLTTNDIWVRRLAGTSWLIWRKLAKSTELDLKADKASPVFTGTVTILSAGLNLSGGVVTDIVRGNGTPRTKDLFTFVDSVMRNATGFSPVNSPIVVDDNLVTIVSKTQGQLNNKQDSLVSGTSIKTVSGISVLGTGDVYAGGNTLNYIRADGTSQNFANSVQNSTIGTMSPSNNPILTGDSFKTAVNKTQGQIDGLNAKVLVSGILYNFPSIAPNSWEETTIAFAGATLGDYCVAHKGGVMQSGLLLQAYCAAADTVTVRASNLNTSGSLDLPNTTYKILVFKY